eukprot:1693301-Pleurochrysis_carterae.AAC.1
MRVSASFSCCQNVNPPASEANRPCGKPDDLRRPVTRRVGRGARLLCPRRSRTCMHSASLRSVAQFMSH